VVPGGQILEYSQRKFDRFYSIHVDLFVMQEGGGA